MLKAGRELLELTTGGIGLTGLIVAKAGDIGVILDGAGVECTRVGPKEPGEARRGRLAGVAGSPAHELVLVGEAAGVEPTGADADEGGVAVGVWRRRGLPDQVRAKQIGSPLSALTAQVCSKPTET